MVGTGIIGRVEECKRLDRCLAESEAQLILVYGRRRVGKTFLIDKYFDGRFDFKFSGEYEKSKEEQLKNFTVELNRQTGDEIDRPHDWKAAFYLLRDYLENLPNGKRIVFFDEMPWMDTMRSDFLASFEYFWNSWGSSQRNLIFIVCGSATSWMRENIIDNKGGLYNRLTCSIYLHPFNLHTTEQYLVARGVRWSRYDIAECYMIMGGIPYYLRLIDAELSYNENIDRIFFKKRAELWDEFNHLYRTLFSNSDKYIQIVEALSKKRNGLTREEIVDNTKIHNNGMLTRILDDLVDSDFVRVYRLYGNKKKGEIYQLADYYSLFYFKYIKGKKGLDEHFWSHNLDSPSRLSWAGYTFEQVCMDHISQIKRKLGISGVLTTESVWYKKADEYTDGAQIDLVIDRQDKVISLCEIKFSVNEYIIDKEYDMKLRNKIGIFRQATGTRKGLGLVMITTYGVKQGKYSSIVDGQVVLDDLFEK